MDPRSTTRLPSAPTATSGTWRKSSASGSNSTTSSSSAHGVSSRTSSSRRPNGRGRRGRRRARHRPVLMARGVPGPRHGRSTPRSAPRCFPPPTPASARSASWMRSVVSSSRAPSGRAPDGLHSQLTGAGGCDAEGGASAVVGAAQLQQRAVAHQLPLIVCHTCVAGSSGWRVRRASCRTGGRFAASHAGAGDGLQLFDANAWDEVSGFQFADITYHRARRARPRSGLVFNRPRQVLNAFRPQTVDELFVRVGPRPPISAPTLPACC